MYGVLTLAAVCAAPPDAVWELEVGLVVTGPPCCISPAATAQPLLSCNPHTEIHLLAGRLHHHTLLLCRAQTSR